MKIQLINVGRSKVTREADIKGKDPLGEAELECRRHLMSSEVYLSETNDPKVWEVNAGIRTVGTVEFPMPIFPSETLTRSPLQIEVVEPERDEQKRGQLTDRIKEKSKELLGYELDVRELRFMVYIHYLLCNEQKIDARKVNEEEMAILSKWEADGHMRIDEKLHATKRFWDILSEIVYLGYVDLHG